MNDQQPIRRKKIKLKTRGKSQGKPQNGATSQRSIVARTIKGLEEVLAEELRQIGARSIKVQNRAVSFEGSKETLYTANLKLRTALRILLPISEFKIRNQKDFYNKIYDINWEQYLSPNDTLAIDTAVSSEIFTNSLFVAMKAKDAIADQFREKTGRRPSVDLEDPTIRFHIHIRGQACTVSLDSSGESLHRRGYRSEAMTAPINEVLAAGLVQIAIQEKTGSVWQPGEKFPDFIDPMCGAGTIPIEAALMAHNIPPGLRRRSYGFMRWPDFDASLWDRIRSEAKANISTDAGTPTQTIFAADVSARAIRIAGENAERAGLPESAIQFETRIFDQYKPPVLNESQPRIVVMNPPYGERLQVKSAPSIEEFYKSLGDSLKQNFVGCSAWVLSSNIPALKRIGLKATVKHTVFNGPLECSFRHFELYAGTRKKDE